MPFPVRSGRVGRGCRSLGIAQNKDLGPEHILSSIKFSKCELLQPHLSRIPIRRTGSSETVPAHSKNKQPSVTAKQELSSLRVWKLLRPGLQRHLSLSGVSGKQATLQLTSKAVTSDNHFQINKGDIVLETTPEVRESPLSLPETIKLGETVTLCGEA